MDSMLSREVDGRYDLLLELSGIVNGAIPHREVYSRL